MKNKENIIQDKPESYDEGDYMYNYVKKVKIIKASKDVNHKNTIIRGFVNNFNECFLYTKRLTNDCRVAYSL